MTWKGDRKRPPLAQGAEFLGHGLAWALSTLLFLLLGRLVDGWLGTSPIFTIIGAFVGAGAGFYSMYHNIVVRPRERGSRDEDEEE